jgi:hypothetical protein
MICLACKCENKIPYDHDWIAKQISISKSIQKDIDVLLASGLLAACYQDASPIRREEKREEEKRKEENATAETNKKSLRFQQPTPQEVFEYAKSIGFYLDGSKFCDYYASKGWVVGKSPMKDWKAAVRTWKQNSDQASSVAKPKFIRKKVKAADYEREHGGTYSPGTCIDGIEII